MKWSAVLPLKGRLDELPHLEKSLTSAFKLNPDELLIAIDAPANREIEAKINDVAEQNRFENLTIIEVERSSEWKMHLAKVMYEAYAEAENDAILTFYVDTMLELDVLKGLELVGKNQAACVSYSFNLYQANLSDRIRNFSYRVLTKRRPGFTGIFWLWRPFYVDLLDIPKFKAIYNGFDAFLVASIQKQTRYKLITRGEVGATALGYQSNDYPWRQFQDGFWHGANNTGWMRALFLTLGMQHPYFLHGYIHAKRNFASCEAIIARSMSLDEWVLEGSRNVPKLNWKFKGTGFVS